jgi:hypothetical protein
MSSTVVRLRLVEETSYTTDWAEWKRSYQNPSQICWLLRQEVIYKTAHRNHFAWIILELSAAITGSDDAMAYCEIYMLSVAAFAVPQRLNIHISVPDNYIEFSTDPKYETHSSLPNLLILYNKSSMRLRISTYHDCWHPN